jgi:hypothetical protein
MRRRSLAAVALAAVLVVPTSAVAESARVLWRQVSSTNPAAPPGGTSEPVQAFKTQEACDRAHERFYKQMDGTRRDARWEYLVSHVCLPDTVDPRGPKVK